jgi:electron transport complex protein RnfC
MKRLRGIRAARPLLDVARFQPKKIPISKEIFLPMGTPWGDLTPLVKIHDEVTAGQMIARDEMDLAPSLHASVSGVITAIKSCNVHAHAETQCVVIRPDEKAAGEPVRANIEAGESPKDLAQRISGAGIKDIDSHKWPLPWRITRPDALPDALSSEPALQQPIEVLIVNGMDRQPGVSLRSGTLESRGKDILESIPFLKKLSGAQRICLTVHDAPNFPTNIESEFASQSVEVIRCPNTYPIALVPMVAQYVSGKEVPQPSGDTRSVGVAVIDVISAIHVLEAARDGQPATQSTIQISGMTDGSAQFVTVPEGALLEDVLSKLDGSARNAVKAVVGGPFLGYAQYQLRIPLTADIDAVFFQDQQEVIRYSDDPCINCGFCVRTCPMALLPNELSKYCEYGKFEKAEENDLFHCIECGICAYVCPARRPMVHLLRHGKHEILASRTEL